MNVMSHQEICVYYFSYLLIFPLLVQHAEKNEEPSKAAHENDPSHVSGSKVLCWLCGAIFEFVGFANSEFIKLVTCFVYRVFF